MREIDQLENLPVAERRVTLLWNEYWLNGVLIERHFITKVVIDHIQDFFGGYWMYLKSRLARRLQRGMGDACPYCNKLIDTEKWEKMFPD
jgi:hypothetical protein